MLFDEVHLAVPSSREQAHDFREISRRLAQTGVFSASRADSASIASPRGRRRFMRPAYRVGRARSRRS